MLYKLHTTLNILGLALGLACAILMSTFFIHEFSFDSFHKKSDRIYRVIDGKKCGTFFAMGAEFKNSVAEIEDEFSFMPISQIHVKKDLNYIEEKDFILAEPSILKILDIPLINGANTHQLEEPNSIIISEKIAKKYFSGFAASGQFMEIAIKSKVYRLKITGVFKDMPSNSSLRINFIGDINLAFSLIEELEYRVGITTNKDEADYRHEWKNNAFRTFVLLKPLTNSLNAGIECTKICKLHGYISGSGGISLQPIKDMYLNSANLEDTDPFITSQRNAMYIFSLIGILLLFVATINFILISNAQNESAKKAIACRKINGASNTDIVKMILSKSVLTAFISLIPALIFVHISLPFFNSHFKMDLDMHLFFKLRYILILVGFTFLTGILSGLYLGISTSIINPLILLRNEVVSQRSKPFYGALVIVQFSVFIMLLTGLFIMKKQYDFALNKDLGFTTENIFVLDLNADELKSRIASIQHQIQSDPNVISCLPTSICTPPSDGVLMISYKDIETGKPTEQESIVVGPGILELLRIPIKEGVSFNLINSKTRGYIIINEAAALKFKVKVGEKISHLTVIGITRNFHFHSLVQKIDPLFIFPLLTDNYPILLVKTNGKNQKVKEHISNIMRTEVPGYFFDIRTLNENLAGFYEKEKTQIDMLAFFSIIIFIISIMGLFGFVSLNLSKRTKEIGIRKINGAKISELLIMYNIQYIKWVAVAFIIGCPIAWYAMHIWLNNFAYKTVMSWWVFALIGLFTLLISMIIVSWQSWKAGSINPVEAVKNE